MQPATIIGSFRYALIDGYICKVIVNLFDPGSQEYAVHTGRNSYRIPENALCHLSDDGRIIVRGTAEFLRKWPGHPVEIEKLPAR